MSAKSTKAGERAPRRRKALVIAPPARVRHDVRVAEEGSTSVFLGRGAEGRELSLGFSRALRGRPKKGVKAAGSSSRNVRMQDAEWAALEALADKRGLSVHAAMREALVHWIARAANVDAKKAARKKAVG